MNLKVPGAILPLGCAILNTRVKTVRGVGTTPLRRTRIKLYSYSWIWHRKKSITLIDGAKSAAKTCDSFVAFLVHTTHNTILLSANFVYIIITIVKHYLHKVPQVTWCTFKCFLKCAWGNTCRKTWQVRQLSHYQSMGSKGPANEIATSCTIEYKKNVQSVMMKNSCDRGDILQCTATVSENKRTISLLVTLLRA